MGSEDSLEPATAVAAHDDHVGVERAGRTHDLVPRVSVAKQQLGGQISRAGLLCEPPQLIQELGRGTGHLGHPIGEVIVLEARQRQRTDVQQRDLRARGQRQRDGVRERPL